MPKDTSYHNILKQCYANIDKFSTSCAHKVAHKLMAEWLLNHRHDRGEVATVGTEILFKNGFRADLVAYWRNDDVWHECIEVCNPMHYLHTVRYRGKKEFNEVLYGLKEEELVDKQQIINIKDKRPRYRNNGYIHFHTDAIIEGKGIARKIDHPCELKRKSDKWDHQTIELSFLVPLHEEKRFRRDIEKCNLEVANLYVVDSKDVEEIIGANTSRHIHKGYSALKRPKVLQDSELIWALPGSS